MSEAVVITVNGSSLQFTEPIARWSAISRSSTSKATANVRAQVAGHAGFGTDSGSLTRVETQTHIVNDRRQPGTADATGIGRARSSTLDSIGVLASFDGRSQTSVHPGQFPVIDVAADA